MYLKSRDARSGSRSRVNSRRFGTYRPSTSVAATQIDDIVERFALDVMAEIPHEEVECPLHVALARGGAVWRDEHVGRIPQRIVGCHRFVAHDVERGRLQVTRAQHIDECGFV